MGRERPTPGRAQRRGRRMALGLGAVLLTLLAVVWVATGVREDSCEHAIVARVPSPNGAWEAVQPPLSGPCKMLVQHGNGRLI